MIAQSGLLCNSLSFRGLRPQRLSCPLPGGAPVTHRPRRRSWPMGLDSPSTGWVGTNQGLPGPTLCFSGATRPRPPG